MMSAFPADSAANKVVIHRIPYHLIGPMIPVLGQYFMKGLSSSPSVTLEEVADHLVKTTFQLWAIVQDERVVGCFLTSVDEDAVVVFGLGGDGLPDWIEQIDFVGEQWARENGVPKIRFAGRKAYQRVLPKYEVVDRIGDQLVYERTLT